MTHLSSRLAVVTQADPCALGLIGTIKTIIRLMLKTFLCNLVSLTYQVTLSLEAKIK